MVATVPYSVLKVAWLAGARIGLADPDFGTSVTMHVANALTLALDLVALAVAVIIHTGSRVPRWVVLPVMWVGYGLLGQIVMMIGPAVAIQLITGQGTDGSAPSPIEGWVYAVVYAGFSGLGLCLLPAFAIYAWQRWGDRNGWGQRLSGIPRSLPAAPVVAVATLTMALAARAARSGSGAELASWSADALIGLIAVCALLGTARGFPAGMRRAVPLAVVWTASGAWTAWGCFSVVMSTVPNDLVTGPTSALDTALYLAKVVAGASMLTAVRRIGAGDHES